VGAGPCGEGWLGGSRRLAFMVPLLVSPWPQALPALPGLFISVNRISEPKLREDAKNARHFRQLSAVP